MPKKNMVIFASGRGSNAVALHEAVEAGIIHAQVKALVCDIPGAPVMDRAKEWGVPVILADRKQFDSKAAFEASQRNRAVQSRHYLPGLLYAFAER